MIVGKGMIANAVKKIDNENYIFFCSGVSNSKELRDSEFEKEKTLLSKYYCKDKCLVYFSSYFVGFDSYLKQEYYKHKLAMENLIKEKFTNYKILRLPQVVGFSKNSNTLTNYLYKSIVADMEIKVFKGVERNLIDIDDIVTLLKYINYNSLFINDTLNIISTKNFKIEKIIEELELIIGKKAIKAFEETEENSFDVIIKYEILKLYKLLNIEFDDEYLKNLIKKYYKEGKI